MAWRVCLLFRLVSDPVSLSELLQNADWLSQFLHQRLSPAQGMDNKEISVCGGRCRTRGGPLPNLGVTGHTAGETAYRGPENGPRQDQPPGIRTTDPAAAREGDAAGARCVTMTCFGPEALLT
ncbi:hypothetical protein NDU88_006239 [Pleurodeles waltl]|uniref:Uncharacterized protein n=1 Tax=Pleurodeles waltl TaxID=8319 RepID=A0AAV7WA66_PLEWA|nr:hypothetical protein NDU88_006239 [Pleurodeles waltl]